MKKVPKMGPKSLQIGVKIGSETIHLHQNASSSSAPAQKLPRQPIWSPLRVDLASIFNGFWADPGPTKRIENKNKWHDGGNAQRS